MSLDDLLDENEQAELDLDFNNLARATRGALLIDDVIGENRHGKKKAVPVATYEPLDGPWSRNNNLGQLIPFQPDANWRQFILKLPEWGMPQVWTLMLGLDYTRRSWPLPAPNYYFEVKALLTVGVGGTTHELELDWKRGTLITLPMNALNVVASYQFPAGAPSFPPDLKLTASLGRGNAAKLWQATNTKKLLEIIADPLNGIVADPLSLYCEIPKFAQSVLLYPSNLAIAPVGNLLYSSDTMIGFGTGAGASSFYMIYYITGDQLASYPMGLPIPSGAETLIVYNPAGGDQVRSTAIFNLGG